MPLGPYYTMLCIVLLLAIFCCCLMTTCQLRYGMHACMTKTYVQFQRRFPGSWSNIVGASYS
jgi:hypothetical protein